jgi:predicted nucleotidyltransferase
MATKTIPQDFRDFLKLLEDEDVAYLLIGGYAVGYYGYPRATADMDVWIAVNPQNAQRTVAALKRFGMRMAEMSEELFQEKGKIIRMGMPPMRLEIQTDISGVDFDECFSRRNRVDLAGIQVNLISLEDLKINKKASGRHKDLDDLEHLP